MSNASAKTARLLAETGASAATEPGGLEAVPSKAEIALFAVGICLAIIWLIRRIIYPRKLSLAKAPGRANTLTAAPVLILLVTLYLLSSVIMLPLHWSLGLEEVRAMVLAVTLDRIIWIVVSLLVAAECFRFGVRRGMGLSLRHWIYDTLRAAYAYLAIFPFCVGLAWITALLVPEQWVTPHPMLEAMYDLPAAWLVLLVLVTVVLVPVAEEILFRGLLQTMVRRYLRNAWAAVLLTSTIFALMHVATPHHIPALFALSVVIGYSYERSGRLLSPILIHAFFNGVSVAVFLARLL